MRPISLRERAGLVLALALRRVADVCLRATFSIDLSTRDGKTARPGMPNSMTPDEVELFAFLHGIGYSSLTRARSPGASGVGCAATPPCAPMPGETPRPAPAFGDLPQFLVEEERTIVDPASGYSVTLRAGKIVTARTHDIEDLRRQGVQLRELPPPAPPAEPPPPAPAPAPAPELEEAPA